MWTQVHPVGGVSSKAFNQRFPRAILLMHNAAGHFPIKFKSSRKEKKEKGRTERKEGRSEEREKRSNQVSCLSGCSSARCTYHFSVLAGFGDGSHNASTSFLLYLSFFFPFSYPLFIFVRLYHYILRPFLFCRDIAIKSH